MQFSPRLWDKGVGALSLRSALAVLPFAGVGLLAVPALPAETDSPADVIEAGALPGETTRRECGADGFIRVLFISGGVVVSRIESSTRCDPNQDAGDSSDGDENVLNQAQAGSQVDAVVQSIVPGGIDGDVFRDFGIPDSSTAVPSDDFGFHGESAEVVEFSALDALGVGGAPAARAMALSGHFERRAARLAPAGGAQRSISGAYSLGAARARAEARGDGFSGLLGDKRFNAWVNGGVVFHSDDRADLAQDGETGVVSGGASYLLSPTVNIGVAGRYGRTDRSGGTGDTDADTWSGAAFTQIDLGLFWLAGILAYSDVDLDARFDQRGVEAAGSTDAESFAGQLVVSRPITVNGVTFVPNLGASFVTVDRDAFTASDGTTDTRVAGSNSTQASLTGGVNVFTNFVIERNNGKLITLTPSFGINGFTNLALFDPLVGLTGQEFEDDVLGLSLNGGLEVEFASGAALGVAANFAGLTGDAQNVSVLGGVAVPF